VGWSLLYEGTLRAGRAASRHHGAVAKGHPHLRQWWEEGVRRGPGEMLLCFSLQKEAHLSQKMFRCAWKDKIKSAGVLGGLWLGVHQHIHC